MKRWLLFPTIALIAVIIGLIWTSTDDGTVLNDDRLSSSPSQSEDSQTALIDTRADELEERIADLEQMLQQEIEHRQQLEIVPASIPEQRSEPATASSLMSDPDSPIDGLSIDELNDLITSSGQLAAKAAINRVSPSVVQISVSGARDSESRDSILEGFFRQPQPGLGSGFFIEFEGAKYIVTNNHVIVGASSITVSPPSEEVFRAEVVGSDIDLDVAILRVPDSAAESIPAVALGDSDAMEVGDWVTAIGNPFGLEHTVTAGIVSSVYRDVPGPVGQGEFRNMIQTDAAINPGNSGGPLVNARGEVIGINTMIVGQGQGLGFAIPINIVKQVLDRLVNAGEVARSWLGVVIRDVNENSAPYLNSPYSFGVWIRNLVPGTPAAASLEVNDIVLSVNGVRVEAWTDLLDAIQYQRIGDTVQMEVLRDGQYINIETGLAVKPRNEELGIFDLNVIGPIGIGSIGIMPVENTAQLAQKFGLATESGMIVADIDPGSLATAQTSDMQQLQVGDVITHVNGHEIRSVADWNASIEEIFQVQELKLEVSRGSAQIEINYPPWRTD